MPWFPAYVGIGSNLQHPVGQVRQALAALRATPQVCAVRHSQLYGSKAWGDIEQPDYCNAVAALLTTLDATALLRRLQQLEQQQGRAPSPRRWAPRIIDLDLLAFDSERQTKPELTLPHPGIVQRSFVLYPLAELAPELWLPGMGRVSTLARALPADDLWLIEAGHAK